MNQLRVLITTPWTAQGLTTLSMRLARFMTSLGHKVGLHAWRKSYQAIGVPEDRDVYLGPFEKAINDYDLVIWPEVVEADQVQRAVYPIPPCKQSATYQPSVSPEGNPKWP